jgi:hypothetical protein
MRYSFLSSPAKWIAALGVCISCFLVSCERGSSTLTAPNPVLQSITVYPKTSTAAQFDNQQYAAEGHYSDGSAKPLNNVAWALSDNTKALVNSTGLVQPFGVGRVIVTATSGGIAGSAELTIEKNIITEGSVPKDFTVANAMKMLYGNFEGETRSSISDLPPVADSSLTLPKQNETYPFFLGQVTESGVSKIFFGTYASPEGECHGCTALIGMAVFIHGNDGWVVESSTKTAVFDGEYGEPPTDVHIVRLGPNHFGVELAVSSTHQGVGTHAVSILVPWNGDIRRAFQDITGEGNGGGCGEEGMLPCVSFEKTIDFVRGANPDYDDMVLTLSGTKLSDGPPSKVVAVTGTERRIFSDGKYIPVAPSPEGTRSTAN